MSLSIPTWCWYCKQEIPTVADVCPYCGRPLNDATKVVRCQKCGKFLLMNTPRCTQCGEPTPQPEPPAPPEEAAEPSAPLAAPPPQDAEAETPPVEFPGDAGAAGEAPETRRMFEELELLSARKAAQSKAANASKTKKERLTILVAALVLVVGVGAFLAISRVRTSSGPTFCKEGEHRWIEADCTAPKTCAICGKIEGERLGHTFVENVCAVCGAYERRFYFTDTESERSGSEVTFRGSVKNFTDAEVQSLQIKLQLYDENKELVETLPGTAIENAGLAPFESTAWQIRFSDSSVRWKYWRVYVSDYAPRA